MLKLGSSAARSTRTAGWAVSGSGGCARTSISGAGASAGAGAGASAGGGVGAGGRQLKCWRMRTGARAAAAAAGPSWGGQRQYLSTERFKIYTKTGDAGKGSKLKRQCITTTLSHLFFFPTYILHDHSIDS